MCGIACIIQKDSAAIREEIVSMTDVIAHRGPDGFGYYHGEHFSFGHRRLSIIDLSIHGSQPMEYIGRYVITYNGEIYNYVELKMELESIGYTFATQCDTEVIMAAYDSWGKGCLDRFNGMFSFALFDRIENNLFLARDRFGVKPLYYTNVNGKFAIASEIKQFTVLEGWVSRANKHRLYDYLRYGGIHDHTNETLFDEVFQLPGGSHLEFDLSEFSYRIGSWYNMESVPRDIDIDFETAKKQFSILFSDAVRLRLRSDVNVGSCLSGGLDSSAIVCEINRVLVEEGAGCRQETVSACFCEKDVDEREYMDAVINQINVESHRIFPSCDNLLADLNKVIWHQDEPFGSPSVYAQWLVYQTAREHGLIVMLDGQGADEHLAGYSSFQSVYFVELLRQLRLLELFKSIRNYRDCYRDYYFSPFRGLFVGAMRLLFSPRLVNMLGKLRPQRFSGRDNWLNMESFRDGKYDEISMPNFSLRAESEAQLKSTSLPKLLHHQDRNSMAHSIESRAPFVDYKLVELTLGLPSDFKIFRSITKYVMRESLSHLLPSKIGTRYDKLGFATPQSQWTNKIYRSFRQELSDACDRLERNVHKDIVLNIFDTAISKGLPIDLMFWRIICSARWMSVFNVSI